MASGRGSWRKEGTRVLPSGPTSSPDLSAAPENGYVQVLIQPAGSDGQVRALLRAVYQALKSACQSEKKKQPGQVRRVVVATGLAAAVLAAVKTLDILYVYYRLCAFSVAAFTILSGYYWLALMFRKQWTSTGMYVLFCACVVGESVGHSLHATLATTPVSLGRTLQDAGYLLAPTIVVPYLVTLVLACWILPMAPGPGASLVLGFAVLRSVGVVVLGDVPAVLRPFLNYALGLVGVVGAKYVEAMLRPQVSTLTAPPAATLVVRAAVAAGGTGAHDVAGKVAAMRRRRTSSSASLLGGGGGVGGGAARMRRTSLPALSLQRNHHLHPQGGSTGVDGAILAEAHGLVSDMLADPGALPPHIVSGLRALATLLCPPSQTTGGGSSGSISRPRPGPMVSLGDVSYSSDSEEIPYTGEKISALQLPKWGKKGVPPNLLRRMSCSTWTTTTSATGMPTLEAEPSRKRATSFRTALGKETPGSSPTHGQQSGSPACGTPPTPGPPVSSGSGSSTGSPSALAAMIAAKSRSYSATALFPSGMPPCRRLIRERQTVCSLHPLTSADISHLSDLASSRADQSAALPAAEDTAETDTSAPSSRRCSLGPGGYASSLPPSREASPAGRGSSPEPASWVRDRDREQLSRTPSDKRLSPISLEVPTPPPSSQQQQQQQRPDSRGSDSGGAGAQEEDGGTSSANGEVQFTLSQPEEDADEVEQLGGQRVYVVEDGSHYDIDALGGDALLNRIHEWDYPIFELETAQGKHILSCTCYQVFLEVGLFETFKIPLQEFFNYFHAVELGYRDKPYHNRMHAADVLHGVYYLTSQPIPGFQMLPPEEDVNQEASDSPGLMHRQSFNVEESYGIMGANYPALELMALYTAAAMHDYDHPGRTNAFLVTTYAPQAILYNDRSVLENHHAAAAWNVFLSKPEYNFLCHLDKSEFKRFRFLVIEAILATDLKRHFEIMAEFNAKANEEDSPGLDWNSEADRLLAMEMCIKLSDINGPCKVFDIHVQWTYRIAEEFYEQGDEEAGLGLPISPYMDRCNPQLAKLQESFINHLVAPLCNAYGESGLLPGVWEDDTDSEPEREAEGSSAGEESGSEDTTAESDPDIPLPPRPLVRKISCLQTKHLEENHSYWVNIIKEEQRQKEGASESYPATESVAISTDDIMEPIEEEKTPASLSRSFSFDKEEDSKL